MKLAVTLITSETEGERGRERRGGVDRESRISYKKYKEVHKSCTVCHGHLQIIDLKG